jgi:hypothetical protein
MAKIKGRHAQTEHASQILGTQLPSHGIGPLNDVVLILPLTLIRRAG